MECPEIGAQYNYEGDNYEVTRVEPGHFLTLAGDTEWVDAIEFTDVVGEGETATILYVMPLDEFVESYELGIIEEGAAPNQDLPEEGEGEAEPKG